VGLQELDPDTIRVLAKVAGIEVPDEDLAPLAAALQQHLASIDALPTMDITDVEPPLVFRVMWDE
jgi:Asp-tRNA(Asn)/Glu-tRNA(Gln) amidotransferase C subunit